MTMDDLMKDAKELLDLRPDGWTKSKLHDVVKLAEETGEVAECLTKSKKTIADLADELSDVMIVCASIALRHGIDLEEACKQKQIRRVSKLVMRFHGGVDPRG